MLPRDEYFGGVAGEASVFSSQISKCLAPLLSPKQELLSSMRRQTRKVTKESSYSVARSPQNIPQHNPEGDLK
jgi:hypothetical protein